MKWYCPPGCARPAHLPSLAAPARCRDGCGPDRLGGTVHGGTYEHDEPGWRQAPGQAWWYHLDGALPQQLVRLATDPAILRWRLVQGALPGHTWQVPVLLSPRPGPSGQLACYAPATDRTWTRDGFAISPALGELTERLHRAVQALDPALDEPAAESALVVLVCDLLSLGHHLTLAELAGEGWLTLTLSLRVLLASCDHEPAA